MEMEIETTIYNDSNNEKSFCDKVIDKMEESIDSLINNELTIDNISKLEKLVDIHKDMSNVKYWKAKESNSMRYNTNYGYNGRYEPYGRDYYNGGYNNSYNRRGVDAKYRGHEYIDGMYNNYSRYEDGREQYNRGNYNAKDDTLNSLRYMLESAVEFFGMLKSEATSPEEMQMIKEYTQRIHEM